MCVNRHLTGLKILTAAMLIALVSNTQAASVFVETNLVDANNDGFLFVDQGTYREWVDVTKTVGLSVNQFGSSSDFANQGFQIATQADVVELFQNAGVTDIDIHDDVETYTAGNIPAYHLLAGLMEHVDPWTQTGGNSMLHGFYTNSTNTSAEIARFKLDTDNNTAAFHLNYNGDWSYNDTHSVVGIFAFRQLEIPEILDDQPGAEPDPEIMPTPTASLAGVLGFGLMAVLRRKRRA